MRSLTLFLLFVLTACAGPSVSDRSDLPARFTATSFAHLSGWGDNRALEVLPAMRLSCTRIVKKGPDALMKADLPRGQTYGAWQKPCLALLNTPSMNEAQARAFFETYFLPYSISAGADERGLFTGYYEATLKGSRTRGGAFQTPLYARPDDLVMVDLGAFRETLKGQRIAGRVVNGRLTPYEERAQIVAGQWPHTDKVLVWVDSPVEAFFVQIQGSGVVQLDDGSVMRIGYAGQNGHPYYAIGRELIKRGELRKDEVSMQSIAAWLKRHRVQGHEIMNLNKSYVFFEEKTVDGAVGAEGIVLTPGRSLAVDRTKIPYGAPLWVDIDSPAPNMSRVQRLMMAQDTGGAIRGAVRGDVFWGYGELAEQTAGAMKSEGRYWILLPR
jgi:membrane-bound lytic murein transglycosylase A